MLTLRMPPSGLTATPAARLIQKKLVRPSTDISSGERDPVPAPSTTKVAVKEPVRSSGGSVAEAPEDVITPQQKKLVPSPPADAIKDASDAVRTRSNTRVMRASSGRQSRPPHRPARPMSAINSSTSAPFKSKPAPLN